MKNSQILLVMTMLFGFIHSVVGMEQELQNQVAAVNVVETLPLQNVAIEQIVENFAQSIVSGIGIENAIEVMNRCKDLPNFNELLIPALQKYLYPEFYEPMDFDNIQFEDAFTLSKYAIKHDRDKAVAWLFENKVFNIKLNRILQEALFAKANNVARFALNFDIDIEAKDFDGRMPLIWAAHSNSEEVIRLLLGRGANINAKDKNGDTPLMRSVNGCHVTTSQLFLDLGADIEMTNHEEETPLIHACAWHSCQMANLLINHGANVHALDKEGKNSLMKLAGRMRYSKPSGICSTVQLLLDKGIDINARDRNGCSALYYLVDAAKDDDRSDINQMIVFFLDRGADIEAVDLKGDTPLIHASSSLLDVVARLLLDKGANIEAKEQNEQTALIVAAQSGSYQNVKLLLDQNADIEARNKQGKSSLMAALFGTRNYRYVDYFKIIELLLARGADANARDENQETPLIHAVVSERYDIAQLLINGGADIHVSDEDGQTLLMYAVSIGSDEMCRWLLDRRANIHAQCVIDGIKCSALMGALQFDMLTMAEMLLDYGADIDDIPNTIQAVICHSNNPANLEVRDFFLRAKLQKKNLIIEQEMMALEDERLDRHELCHARNDAIERLQNAKKSQRAEFVVKFAQQAALKTQENYEVRNLNQHKIASQDFRAQIDRGFIK